MGSLATNALTNRADVEADLGITPGSENDKLHRLINAASDFIESNCGRTFYRDTAIVERVAGYGQHHLILDHTPVNSIAGITLDGSSVDLVYVTIDNAKAGLIGRPGGWPTTAHTIRDTSRSLLPGTERLLYSVTYDGGWYTQKQADDNGALTRALPYDIEDACIELVRIAYKAKARDPSIASEKLMSWGVSYLKAAAPASVMLTLARYRRPI